MNRFDDLGLRGKPIPDFFVGGGMPIAPAPTSDAPFSLFPRQEPAP